jgi:two-component system chemotaxis response regulator CheB
VIIARDPIGVLVVESSLVDREHLVGLVSSDPGFRLLATARSGQRALDVLRNIPRPGLILMNLDQPDMDGIETVRAIMERHPAPIMALSARRDHAEAQRSFKAMDAGALAVVNMPPKPGSPGHAQGASELLASMRIMSEVKVVRRWPKPGAPDPIPKKPVPSAKRTDRPSGPAVLPSRDPGLPPLPRNNYQVVAIGASTGGPLALKILLQNLRPGFPLPILIVQHMAFGFTSGFTTWLGEDSGQEVRLAEEGMDLVPGRVLVAPEGVHMEVGRDFRIHLHPALPGEVMAPAVSRLFRSVNQVFGPTAIAVLLTGMGKDGADEMARLKAANALTFVQDESSSVVHGMPGEAIRLGGAEFILPPSSIGEVLERTVRQ